MQRGFHDLPVMPLKRTKLISGCFAGSFQPSNDHAAAACHRFCPYYGPTWALRTPGTSDSAPLHRLVRDVQPLAAGQPVEQRPRLLAGEAAPCFLVVRQMGRRRTGRARSLTIRACPPTGPARRLLSGVACTFHPRTRAGHAAARVQAPGRNLERTPWPKWRMLACAARGTPRIRGMFLAFEGVFGGYALVRWRLCPRAVEIWR